MELDKFMKRLYDVVLAVAGNYPYGPRFLSVQTST